MSTPELVTVLWRLERNGEQRSAAVFTHPHGLDLRAMVGDQLLHAQVFADIRLGGARRDGLADSA